MLGIITMNFDISTKLTLQMSPIICHYMKHIIKKEKNKEARGARPNPCKGKQNKLPVKIILSKT